MEKPRLIRRIIAELQKKPMLLVVPAGLAVVTVLVIVFRREIWDIFSSPERIESAVNSWGIWAPAGFILLQVVQVVIFVIPGEVPQIAGGYLFGTLAGSFYSVVGILLGSTVNFMLARLLGVPFVRSLFKESQIKAFDGITHSSRAQIAFFLLFVIPGIPKDILCYVAGLSPLRFLAFLVISTIGRLPGILGSAAMGNAAASKEWLFALILLGVAVVLFVLGLIFRERIHGFIERFALKPSRDPDRRRSPDPELPTESGDT